MSRDRIDSEHQAAAMGMLTDLLERLERGEIVLSTWQHIATPEIGRGLVRFGWHEVER